MRFCDFFIKYQIRRKEIKNTIPFNKLPLYRKIFFILVFTCIAAGVIFYISHNKIRMGMSFVALLITMLIFGIYNSKRKNLMIMLNDHYIPYSKKRMNMVIDILREYDIDIHNENIINMLIEEARIAQEQSDYLEPLKKPFKTLYVVIAAIFAYFSPIINAQITYDNILIIIVLVLLIFAWIMACIPVIKDIIYKEYNLYNELISDLRQIKIFYSQK